MIAKNAVSIRPCIFLFFRRARCAAVLHGAEMEEAIEARVLEEAAEERHEQEEQDDVTFIHSLLLLPNNGWRSAPRATGARAARAVL